MKVGDLVRGSDRAVDVIGLVGVVVSVEQDPQWRDLQVKVWWPSGFWTQSIKNLEVINESR